MSKNRMFQRPGGSLMSLPVSDVTSCLVKLCSVPNVLNPVFVFVGSLMFLAPGSSLGS